MTGRQKLLEYAKKRSVFRASDVEHELWLSRMCISRLAKEGQLEPVSYRLYAFALNEFNEDQSIQEVAADFSFEPYVLCQEQFPEDYRDRFFLIE